MRSHHRSMNCLAVKYRKVATLGLLLFVLHVSSRPARFQTQEVTSSSPQRISRDPRYPAHWWTPVSKEGAPSWEILPQEAGPGEVILSKRNELGLLSNFAATPFVYEGKRYASLEGFWQMMKYPEGPNDARAKFPGLEWKYTREQVAQLTSFEAKNAGHTCRREHEEDGHHVGYVCRESNSNTNRKRRASITV